MNNTQIGNSVVCLVMIQVVNFSIWPVAVMQCPGGTMRKQFLIGYLTEQISV